jgi:hypothetical protein
MTLQLLRPGESSLIDFTVSATFEYPLDSILVVPHQTEQLQHLARAMGLARRAPWMPVLVGSGRIPIPARELDVLANGLHIATLPYSVGGRADVGAIRAAIRDRGAPTADLFVAWCGVRLGVAIEPILRKCLSKGRLSRREAALLRRHGQLSALEWRALFLLVQLHSDAWTHQRPIEWLADQHGTTRKTVWEWASKLLDIP